METPETTWEERFDKWFIFSSIRLNDRVKSIVGGEYVKDFIRAEKTKSYQEGLEKAKEVVGVAYLAARGKEENKVLLKAQEKIQELIDKG